LLGQTVIHMITCLTNILRKATENAIFDATDYQIPVTHLKGAKGDGGNRRYASSKQWDQKEMECDRREIEIY